MRSFCLPAVRIVDRRSECRNVWHITDLESPVNFLDDPWRDMAGETVWLEGRGPGSFVVASPKRVWNGKYYAEAAEYVSCISQAQFTIANNQAMASKTQTVKVLKGQEAEDAVLQYLKRMNRPYGAVDVSANLKGAVPKAATPKILVALAEKGALVQKVYGKTSVFAPNQASIPPAAPGLDAECAALDAAVAQLGAEVARLGG
ncbi:Tat binding protein 1-interacting protein-domain-containing protein, partial [Hygrophoropsis aurantiaca]